MAYELLVLDIDGTLMRTDKTISERTIDRIVEIQNDGIKVAIASGRSTEGIMSTARRIGLTDFGGFIISYNGAKISNAATGEVIYDICLPDKIVSEIYDFSKKMGTGIMSYHNGNIITENEEDPYVVIDSIGSEIGITKLENFGQQVKYPVNKCLLTGDPSMMEDVEKAGAKEFEGRLSVYRSEDFYVEMMPLGIDKAYGLSRLLDRLGLSRSQMICCGDGFNDISMIKYAGLGVAMDNASDEVKKFANYIAPHCDEDGVVDVIDRYVVI
ncbi:Cof-type HAD-IIB family hydrolase [Eubacterium xylanophilum]|uniref:Cof-type HAD-IIB family hydrolase n=1 Tax=Eubacterium xylanophilum TaxID=39497 RepID=UPI00047D9133|nr:Cof-type HAD-IIB family hydrolase [Eubacterium xylanophilum]